MRSLAAIALPVLLAGCGGLPEIPLPEIPFMAAKPSGLCAGNGVVVSADFPAAGRHDCVVGPDGEIVVSVDHEPTLVEGINPSPWYAFKLTSDAPRDQKITLDYTDYKHRYTPLYTLDRKVWNEMTPEGVKLNERKTRATFTVKLAKGDNWVAGQMLSDSEDNVRWTRDALSGKGFSETRYGTSLRDRPLIGFSGGGSLHAIVILTRQHPPETSGQDAYRGFVDRLIERNDDKAKAFRARTKVIVAPMPNPDGVDGGYWRLNAGGTDLNRDWTKLTQPETKALTGWIQKETAGRPVVAMMDFHSTDRSVIYAPPLNSPSPTIGFLTALKTKLDTLKQPPEWSYAHRADSGNSKSWALETLKAPGITVELWDDIPWSEADALGRAAADAMIDYFTK